MTQIHTSCSWLSPDYWLTPHQMTSSPHVEAGALMHKGAILKEGDPDDAVRGRDHVQAARSIKVLDEIECDLTADVRGGK
eukprot:m.179890 g.179890  ORF g.179890 m.179890 type:complete len:80 (+) comp9987_c0_seq8:271-510(+)